MVKQNKLYSQCVLHNKDRRLVTWIPSEFAQVGQCLKLKDKNIWVDGWIVMDVWTTDSKPEDPRVLIRHHRKATKDSMKKE